MGWFGPQSGTCSCCGGTCDCNDLWQNIVDTFSTLAVAASGSGLTYSLSASVALVNDSPTRCLQTVSAQECANSESGLTYRITGPSTCALGGDPSAIGKFKINAYGTYSPPATCNGVTYSSGNIYHGASIQCDLSTGCNEDGTPWYRIIAQLQYALHGTASCDDFFACGWQLPRPSVDMGYTVEAYDGSGHPSQWSHANGTNQTSYILGESGPYLLPQGSECSTCCGYEYYSTRDTYDVTVSSLASLPTSITLDPVYNPASITGTVTLS